MEIARRKKEGDSFFLCVCVIVLFLYRKVQPSFVALSNLTMPNINQFINLVFDIKQQMIWKRFARSALKFYTLQVRSIS